MTITTRQQFVERAHSSPVGATIPFEAINDPGCYVCHWSGHLIRVPEDAIKPGRSPLLSFKANEPLLVTRISSDPYLPLSKARLVAADFDLAGRF